MLIEIMPEEIKDVGGARIAIKKLLNLVEELAQANTALRQQVQDLRDENARLKGEQGKPDIKGKKSGRGQDHSSEKERKALGGEGERRARKELAKNAYIPVDREEVVTVARSELPSDAEFKGYEPSLVQDISFTSDNVRFLKEKYYSASEHKTYLAGLPAGYEGQFGPHVRALVVSFYYVAGMSEPKISELLKQMGVHISAGQVSNILTQDLGVWQVEADEMFVAGLKSTSWQNIDDTPTRVNGENAYCHILSNPFYSWYATRARKDRLTVISVLAGNASQERIYLLNDRTADWLETFGVPRWAQHRLADWPHDLWLTADEMRTHLERDLAPRLNTQQQARVLEAAALSAYHAQTEVPIIPIMVSDDAPQFNEITTAHSLCWIHEGRHYKKLTPVVVHHQQLLETFRGEFWTYYGQLQLYRSAPSEAKAQHLRTEFVRLFSTQVGYAQLDVCIAATLSKQSQLLTVLEHPEIPLHNNTAELAARQRVRKRDVSFGPRTPDGVKAWDTFMSLAETAKKLGISFYAFVYDRMAKLNVIPPLAQVLMNRAANALAP
jgi:hypothetical protein